MTTAYAPLETEKRIKFDAIVWVLLLCGALSGQTVNLIGLIYLSEIFLPLVAIWLLATRGDKGLFSDQLVLFIIVLQIISLLGFVVSDFAVGSIPERYLRGWARLIFLISNTVALLAIARHDKKYLWAFIFGIAVGLVVSPILRGIPISDWKLSYGFPIGLATLCLACCLPVRIIAILAAVLGVVSIALDSRILGATLIVTAAIVFSKSKRHAPGKNKASQYVKLAVIGAIGAGLIAFVIAQTNDVYKERREGSNNGREAGISVAIKAILESPLLGYGSWTQSEKFARLLVAEQMEKMNAQQKLEMQDRVLASGDKLTEFYPHSQVLQVWVEGGIVGALFFIVFGYLLVKYLYWYAVNRAVDRYLPVFFFLLIGGIWEWIASPFAGITRVNIAIALAIIYVSYLERRETVATGQTDKNSRSDQVLPVPQAATPYTVLQRKRA